MQIQKGTRLMRGLSNMLNRQARSILENKGQPITPITVDEERERLEKVLIEAAERFLISLP